MTNRESYLKALKHLAGLRMPEPSAELIASVGPHLSESEIQDILDQVAGGESVYFASPPLRVNWGYQIISANRAHTGSNGQERKPYLCYSYAKRTLKSYASGLATGDVFIDTAFSDKAIAYAQQHWADQLVLDTWADFITVYLDDPKDLHKSWFSKADPRTKLALYFTTSRPLYDNDNTAPESEWINDKIVEITHSSMIAKELRGGRGGSDRINCWRCGSGIGVSECSSCNAQFEDDHIRCECCTPLPPKLVEYARSIGHQFETDPAIAQAAERQRWES